MPIEKFLRFENKIASPSGKTFQWQVRNGGNILMGYIVWWAPWRKYCYQPASNIVLDTNCMQEIRDFIAVAEKERADANRSRTTS